MTKSPESVVTRDKRKLKSHLLDPVKVIIKTIGKKLSINIKPRNTCQTTKNGAYAVQVTKDWEKWDIQREKDW